MKDRANIFCEPDPGGQTMEDFDPAFAPVARIAEALSAGETSAVVLLEQTIARIKELDPALNAFVRLTEERAFSEAKAADDRRRKGTSRGPLDGVPYAVKDIFDVEGTPTMAGTRLLQDEVAERDCNAVQRLADAGMVLVGKTHTVQLAFHPLGTNPELGTPHNPWHAVPHLPGGSSSGSAVAVAAGMVPAALGSDTAGSIRAPASLSGTVGFKPTGGRLGRGGVRPLSWSLDTIGPLTRTVHDAALVAQAMQGVDPEDETTWPHTPVSFGETIGDGVKDLEVLVCDTMFFDDCHPDVVSAVEAVARVLSDLGAVVTHASIPEIEEAKRWSDEGTVISTEAYAVNGDLLERHGERIDPRGLWMVGGKNVTGTAYYHALRERYSLQRRVSERMAKAHAILSPTCAYPAWPVGESDGEDGAPVSYVRDTSIGNCLDLASVSIPCGFTPEGLPIGAMISARSFHDEIALRIAHAYQQATDWHTREPGLDWVVGSA